MSYELYFKPGSVPVTSEAFCDYFRDRPGYTLQEGQVWYENEDTGVYFSFEYHAEDADGSDVDEPHHPFWFSINFFRPSYFILEAEPEVTALVDRFAFEVSDGHPDGMDEGPYARDLLVRGWQRGNRFGVAGVMRQADLPPVVSLPGSRLHALWQWNLGRAALQRSIGEGQFVPTIMLFDLDGAVVTAAAWPDGIPSILPMVDYLIVDRNELAPRSFLRKKPDMVFVRWEDAAPHLGKHDTRRRDGAIDLNYAECPPDLAKFVRGLARSGSTAKRLAPDQVLDRELVDHAGVRTSGTE